MFNRRDVANRVILLGSKGAGKSVLFGSIYSIMNTYGIHGFYLHPDIAGNTNLYVQTSSRIQRMVPDPVRGYPDHTATYNDFPLRLFYETDYILPFTIADPPGGRIADIAEAEFSERETQIIIEQAGLSDVIVILLDSLHLHFNAAKSNILTGSEALNTILTGLQYSNPQKSFKICVLITKVASSALPPSLALNQYDVLKKRAVKLLPALSAPAAKSWEVVIIPVDAVGHNEETQSSEVKHPLGFYYHQFTSKIKQGAIRLEPVNMEIFAAYLFSRMMRGSRELLLGRSKRLDTRMLSEQTGKMAVDQLTQLQADVRVREYSIEKVKREAPKPHPSGWIQFWRDVAAAVLGEDTFKKKLEKHNLRLANLQREQLEAFKQIESLKQTISEHGSGKDLDIARDSLENTAEWLANIDKYVELLDKCASLETSDPITWLSTGGEEVT